MEANLKTTGKNKTSISATGYPNGNLKLRKEEQEKQHTPSYLAQSNNATQQGYPYVSTNDRL
jgi:hypothetical protein